MSISLWDQCQSMGQTKNTINNSVDRVSDEAIERYARSKWLRHKVDDYIKDDKFRRKSIEALQADLKKLSNNEAKSLLHVSNILDDRSLENISLDSGDYKNLLITYLQSRQDPLSTYRELILYKIHNVLPEEYLGWFKDDLRCSLFLAYLVEDSIFINAYKGREELISVVTDYLRYEIHMFIEEYAQNLPHYKVYYDRVGEHKTVNILYVKSVYLKNRSKDKDLKWLDSSNQDQIDWAYNYLSEEKRSYIILEDIFFPQTNEEKYELILASLDVLSNVKDPNIGTKNQKNFSPRGYTLHNMENAWRGRKNYSSQNLSSDNDSVKIYSKNLPKLKGLMKFSGLTANKMINKSIEQMYDKLIVEKMDK